MSGLKLNFVDDSASIVGGKPVHSVKRKRQISTSSEEEEEVVKEAEEEEEEYEATEEEQESDKKKNLEVESKSTKVVKKDTDKKKYKTSKKPSVEQQSKPIYEDYLPDTSQINSTLEKIVHSYLEKNIPKPKQRKDDDDEEETATKKPSKSTKNRVKSEAAKKLADQRALLQIAKSFEALQKRFNTYTQGNL